MKNFTAVILLTVVCGCEQVDLPDVGSDTVSDFDSGSGSETETETGDPLAPGVYDGNGEWIGIFWRDRGDGIITVGETDQDFIFDLNVNTGEVIGRKDHNFLGSECQEYSIIRRVQVDQNVVDSNFCFKEFPEQININLLWEHEGQFAIAKDVYFDTSYWHSDLDQPATCEPWYFEECIAEMQPIVFPQNFQLPIQIVQ